MRMTIYVYILYIYASVFDPIPLSISAVDNGNNVVVVPPPHTHSSAWCSFAAVLEIRFFKFNAWEYANRTDVFV